MASQDNTPKKNTRQRRPVRITPDSTAGAQIRRQRLKSATANVESDNVQAEIPTTEIQENVMPETNEFDAEIQAALAESETPAPEVTDESVTIQEEPTSGVMEGSSPGTEESGENSGEKSGESGDATTHDEDSPVKFTIPENPTDLVLEDDSSRAMGIKLLTFIQKIHEIDAVFAAQNRGESKPAILEAAKSSKNEEVKELFKNYEQLLKAAEEMYANLKAKVEETSGKQEITPEKLDALKEKRVRLMAHVKKAAETLREGAELADEEDTLAFCDALVLPSTRKSGGKSSGGSSGKTYNQTTNARPVIGANGGTITIKGSDKSGNETSETVKQWTEFGKTLTKVYGMSVTTGDVHKLWGETVKENFKDCDSDITKWNTWPSHDLTFPVTSGDKTVEVTIHFVAPGDKKSAA
jgi:hypothetical protein